MKQFSISELNKHVNGEIIGSVDRMVSNCAFVNLAKVNELTLIAHKKYLPELPKTKASVIVIEKSLEDSIQIDESKTYIFVENADFAMAKILSLFCKALPTHEGIHSTAVIQSSCTIGKNVVIGPNCYIGNNCTIGDNTIIYANVSIYDNSTIGKDCVIWPGAMIRESTVMGDNCTISANCSIGNDGFGYVPSNESNGIFRVPHIGNVIIGNNVDIGANSCIDKGKFSSTIIGDNTKIDNLVQIGHNCVIGKGVIICGAVGISGSVTIDDGAVIAGGAGLRDHVHIGKKSTVGARSGVLLDVPDGETHAGYPADNYSNTMRQWAAVRQLPDIIKTVKRLAKKLDGLK